MAYCVTYRGFFGVCTRTFPSRIAALEWLRAHGLRVHDVYIEPVKEQ